jgi:hypothetical protein
LGLRLPETNDQLAVITQAIVVITQLTAPLD